MAGRGKQRRGTFNLRVLRPAGGGAYTGTGTSDPGIPAGTGAQTFAANLPIAAGDLIGLNQQGGAGLGFANAASSSTMYWNPPLADGSTMTPGGPYTGAEYLFNASCSRLRSSAPSVPPLAHPKAARR